MYVCNTLFTLHYSNRILNSLVVRQKQINFYTFILLFYRNFDQMLTLLWLENLVSSTHILGETGFISQHPDQHQSKGMGFICIWQFAIFNFTLKDIVKEGKMSSIFPFLPFESRTTYKNVKVLLSCTSLCWEMWKALTWIIHGMDCDCSFE